MYRRLSSISAVLLLASTLACDAAIHANPVVMTSNQIASARRTPPAAGHVAVFAGGCFWGVEAVFEHVRGVTDVTSGYSGGDAKTANYRAISGGDTGHAEAVRVTYDPTQVSYEQLLEVFFSVAHDPTELNRQGPDTGTQYRSAVFYSDDEQKRITQSYIARLEKAKAFERPIVTQVAALDSYYEAEGYHQNYLARHPNEPYIVTHDKPKIANLRKRFPALYK